MASTRFFSNLKTKNALLTLVNVSVQAGLQVALAGRAASSTVKMFPDNTSRSDQPAAPSSETNQSPSLAPTKP